MFKRTSYDEAPWVVLNANNKKVAILSALRFILNSFDYPDKTFQNLRFGLKVYITTRSE